MIDSCIFMIMKKNSVKKIEIFVNQIGYLPNSTKIAYTNFECVENQTEFFVKEKESEKIVYSGIVTNPIFDEKLNDDTIFSADFSDFNSCGEFFIQIGQLKSFVFQIQENVFNEILNSSLEYFTQSRCGQGKCHTGIAKIYGTENEKNVQGGWHDAGDYGRYVIAGTKTVMDLLFAYKNLESQNSTKKATNFDILNEVRFELEWLLQMQREDGAVFHKISCYNFCRFIMPEEETEQIVLSPISTSATADFAGCLAYASSFFTKIDVDFSTELLNAALKAQEYLENHDDEFFTNPPEITTGGYGDKDVNDERYFALCGLFVATKNINFLNKALKIREEKINCQSEFYPYKYFEGFAWGMVLGYGTKILLEFNENAEKSQKIEEKIILDLKNSFIEQADYFIQIAKTTPFSVCGKMFSWGSNAAFCDIAHSFLVAYKISGEKKYFDFAKSQINYVLGCNPLNICYVTGFGSNSPKNPHHRPSGASKKLTNGMLVGGPTSWKIDEYIKKHNTNVLPMKNYADNVESYSTNEIAIYWNSAFIYVLSEIL